MALSYLTGTVTQGSADAFAVGEIATALSGISNVAYRLRELLLELPAFTATGSSIEVAITRRTKTAMPLISDRDVIAKVFRYAILTTSGAYQQERVVRIPYAEDDELLIVEDPLYLVVDSTSTTLTSTFTARLGYERVSISALDRLSLLTQSLE